MKHATFKDFVREAYYHGLDLIVDVSKVNENAQDVMPQVGDLLLAKRFDEVEELLTKNYNKIMLRGVVTYWPTEIERKAAVGRMHRGCPD